MLKLFVGALVTVIYLVQESLPTVREIAPVRLNRGRFAVTEFLEWLRTQPFCPLSPANGER